MITIDDFARKASTNSEIADKVNDILDRCRVLPTVQRERFLQKEMVSLAKEYGYDIAYDDNELSDDELENVAGGVGGVVTVYEMLERMFCIPKKIKI